MALEVPTHALALTPSFQHIQPFQLLRAEAVAQSNEALATHMEEIQPMCCVADTGFSDATAGTHEAQADCFTQGQIVCDLDRFRCDNGVPTVYFRRSGGRKRVNMVPVVRPRPTQTSTPVLYVSTTIRFCRQIQTGALPGEKQGLFCQGCPDYKRPESATRYASGSKHPAYAQEKKQHGL